jgi:hypothetical protein
MMGPTVSVTAIAIASISLGFNPNISASKSGAFAKPILVCVTHDITLQYENLLAEWIADNTA